MDLSSLHFDAAIQAPIGSSLLEDDSTIIRRDGWYQIVTPSVKDVSLNEVILSRVEASEADHRIAETFSIYSEHNLPFKWSIGPMSTPEIIERRIAPKAIDSWDFRGMVIDSKAEFARDAKISVERLDAGNFEEFLQVFLSGWGLEQFADRARAKFEPIVHDGSFCPYYLARRNGLAVGSAGSVLKDGYGYLVGTIVLKQFRGSGVYRALIGARLSALSKMGFPFAVTQAREASASIGSGLVAFLGSVKMSFIPQANVPNRSPF